LVVLKISPKLEWTRSIRQDHSRYWSYNNFGRKLVALGIILLVIGVGMIKWRNALGVFYCRVGLESISREICATWRASLWSRLYGGGGYKSGFQAEPGIQFQDSRSEGAPWGSLNHRICDFNSAKLFCQICQPCKMFTP
jgi:hypothetical protein